MKYRVQAFIEIEVEIANPNVLARVLENHNDAGEPVEFGEGLDGWRDNLYDLDEDGVIEMLAYNIALHHRPLHTLDGWGDLEPPRGDDGKYIIPEGEWCPQQAATAELTRVIEWNDIELVEP